MAANIKSIHWDFGDGETSSEVSPVHVYAMPGKYESIVEMYDIYDNFYTASETIYVYENDYSSLTKRVITKSGSSFRFASPQEKVQGIGWSEYTGSDWPFPNGITGACKVLDENDESILLVTDGRSFKTYQLGKEDHWQDGGNDDYAGSEIEADILLREHAPPIEASAKIRHSESHTNLRPWYKDRRNIDDYNEYGFRTPFKSSMYFREDSSPEDRAEVKFYPRKAQIVSDRHIESEALQSGVKLTGAPWRLISVQQFFEQIDTAGSPDEKQMSEKTWAELVAAPLIWLGRSIELVSLDGTHVMPWDKGSNQRSTGSFAGVTLGPDGNDRSAISFGAADSMAVDTTIPAGDLSIILWLRSPTSPCTIFAAGTLTIQLVNVGGDWEIQWNDGTNVWDAPINVPLTSWTNIVLSRKGYDVEIYVNGVFANTRALDENLGYATPVTFYGGAVTGFEPRVLEEAMTADAVKWLYNDVIENEGQATCAMY